MGSTFPTDEFIGSLKKHDCTSTAGIARISAGVSQMPFELVVRIAPGSHRRTLDISRIRVSKEKARFARHLHEASIYASEAANWFNTQRMNSFIG
jgi:hypothetical protein